MNFLFPLILVILCERNFLKNVYELFIAIIYSLQGISETYHSILLLISVRNERVRVIIAETRELHFLKTLLQYDPMTSLILTITETLLR